VDNSKISPESWSFVAVVTAASGYFQLPVLYAIHKPVVFVNPPAPKT
jgi:hypothetical protein